MDQMSDATSESTVADAVEEPCVQVKGPDVGCHLWQLHRGCCRGVLCSGGDLIKIAERNEDFFYKPLPL